MVFLAVGVSLLLALIMGVAIFLINKQHVEAARFLRPQETVAVFTHAERGNWKTYNKIFPILELVPAITSQNATLAVVKRGNQLGWVLLGDSPLTASSEPDEFAAPTIEVASSMDDWHVAEKTEQTLALYAPFQHLSRTQPGDRAWAYVDLQHVRAEVQTDLDKLLLTAAKQWPAAILWMNGGEHHVLLYGNNPPANLGTAPEDTLEKGSTFVFTISQASLLWTALDTLLPPRERDIVRGRLQEHVRQTLGKDVSLEYDLLPLFSQGMRFVMHAQGFVLEGSAPTKQHQDILDRIAASIRRDAPRALVEQHTFEKNFSTTVLRPSESASREERMERDGWDTLIFWNAARELETTISRKNTLFRIARRTVQSNGTKSIARTAHLPNATAAWTVSRGATDTLFSDLLGLNTQSDLLPQGHQWSMSLNMEGRLMHLLVK